MFKIAQTAPGDNARLTVHGRQELGVALRLFDLIDQQLHTVHGVERIEHLAQDPDAVELIIIQQEFFFPGPGAVDINGRKHPLVHQSAIEMDFHITGAFELLKDDLIHPTPGIHQRRRDNRQTPAFLDIAGRPKKAFGFLQGVRVNATLTALSHSGARSCYRRAPGV